MQLAVPEAEAEILEGFAVDVAALELVPQPPPDPLTEDGAFVLCVLAELLQLNAIVVLGVLGIIIKKTVAVQMDRAIVIANLFKDEISIKAV